MPLRVSTLRLLEGELERGAELVAAIGGIAKLGKADPVDNDLRPALADRTWRRQESPGPNRHRV